MTRADHAAAADIRGLSDAFFFDANWSWKLVEALRALEQDVTHLRDHFDTDATDEMWIPYVGEKQFVLISKDVQIWRNPQQRAILRAANIVTFFTAKGVGDLDKWAEVQWLMKAWPNIERRARCKPPATFIIGMDCKISVLT